MLAKFHEQDLSGRHDSPEISEHCPAERKELLSLARDGSAEHRFARRANAILLLDDGLSCERGAEVLYLDDDTIRGWRKLHDGRGIAGLEQFDAGGSSSRLTVARKEALKVYVAQALPRSTREIEIRRGSVHLLTRESPAKLGGSVRFGHGQLPRHQPKGFSGFDVNWVWKQNSTRDPAHNRSHHDAPTERAGFPFGPSSISAFAEKAK